MKLKQSTEGKRKIADIAAVFSTPKADPEKIGGLTGRPGVYPAYHMNKEHWITLVLNDKIPKKEVFGMIDFSFEIVDLKK